MKLSNNIHASAITLWAKR